MQNKNIILAVVTVLLIGGFLIFWNNQDFKEDGAVKQKAQQVEKKEVQVTKTDNAKVENNSFADLSGDKPIYYYGSECPHCKDVLAYLDKNDIYSKVDFIKKEVRHDPKNSKELTEAAQKCGLNPANIGVPFVFDNGKCHMGGPDVEKFFAQKAGLE